MERERWKERETHRETDSHDTTKHRLHRTLAVGGRDGDLVAVGLEVVVPDLIQHIVRNLQTVRRRERERER
jgi:hypothetical protein